ncbi:hypothetical protein M8J77_018282 [Diaphorina citri]|nr:hypothetical protein M8J77_018282 [Diaphorina citri]
MAIETSITVPSSHHESSKPSHNASYLFSWIEINVTYFKTVPGIVKLLQLVSRYYFETMVQIKSIIL